MATAPEDYLHTCAHLHPTLLQRLSGKAERLESVERAVEGVRSSRKLTHDALKKIIESPDFSGAQKFWTWPSASEMQSALGNEELDLWNLPKNEKPLIRKLRGVFKTFEAVSVVLRFVVPEHYGILSTPVEHVLGIQPASESIDRYMNYVSNLRVIRDKRNFKTAALVDQALWTLQVGVYGGRLDDTDQLKKQHQRDKFLRGIRANNLADALYGSMSILDLAEALSFERLEIASDLLALEYERAIRGYAGNRWAKNDLDSIIEGTAPGHLRGAWQRCRALRNRAVHARPLDHREAEEMIAAIRVVRDLTTVRRNN
ncbi:MAG: hypothetical protein K2Y23_02185 [Cyanobacteria bacterium]|nr:hypothetical protein [Cyanobacteriota bacterium]